MADSGVKRQAFAAVCQGDAFGIGLAVEDESGYYPQEHLGSFATYEEAGILAGKLNTSLGLWPDQAAHIVCSSFKRQKRPAKTKDGSLRGVK